MGITTALNSSGEWSLHLNNYINMNCLAIFCLAAAVSAEADPYYLGGYGYGLGYAGIGYAGLGYGVHHAAGYARVSPSASVNIAGLAPAAVPAVGGLYAGAGRYVANSAGTVHVAKREAEADAFYGAGYGLGYAGLGHHVAAGYSNVSPSGSLNIAGLAPAAIPA